MSGAQAKAAIIAGCIGVIAEVHFCCSFLFLVIKYNLLDQKLILQISKDALMKRFVQGWLNLYSDNLDKIITLIREYKQNKQAISIGYLGNVVDLWYVISSRLFLCATN